jgi:hypothetical protein
LYDLHPKTRGCWNETITDEELDATEMNETARGRAGCDVSNNIVFHQPLFALLKLQQMIASLQKNSLK